MDFIKKSVVWDEKELLDSFMTGKKIPGYIPQKVQRTKTLLTALAIGAAILLGFYVKDTVEHWNTGDYGNHLTQILMLFLFFLFFLLFVYLAFFREKHAVHMVLQQNRDRLLRPRTYTLEDGVFTEDDGEDKLETQLTDRCCVYFTQEFVSCIETDGVHMFTRWNMPRRVFDSPAEEQAFREACGKYCAVQDV